MVYKGEVIGINNTREAINKGIALVPEDRKRHGLLLHMSVKDNITLPIVKRISKATVINKSKEINVVKNYQKLTMHQMFRHCTDRQ